MARPDSVTPIPPDSARGCAPFCEWRGYIDDALIGTGIRVRYDHGFGNNRPDRAEFFYAKCGCFRPADPNAPGPVPSDPAETRAIEFDLDYQDVVLGVEYAFEDRFSVFGELPVRQLTPEVIDEGMGLGDVRAGLKLAVLADSALFVTAQLRAYFPTGDAAKGLGTAHPSVEPALLLLATPADRLQLAGELRVWAPIDGSSSTATGLEDNTANFSGSVFRYGVGLAYDVSPTASALIAPVVELVGWSVLGGIETVSDDGIPMNATWREAAGTNIVNLKVGLRLMSEQGFYLYAGYGEALTRNVWYQRVVRVESGYAF